MRRGYTLSELLVGSFTALIALAILTMLLSALFRGVRRGMEEGEMHQTAVTAMATLLADLGRCNSAGVNLAPGMLGLQRQADATDKHQPVFEDQVIIYAGTQQLTRREVVSPELTFLRLEPLKPDLEALAAGSGTRILAHRVAEFSVVSPEAPAPFVGRSLRLKLTLTDPREERQFTVERTCVLRASL